MRKKPFDLNEALERAVQFTVAKMEEGQKEAPDWHVNQYFSATDIASRVRSAVAEEVDGRPYDAYGVTGYAGGVRISGLGGMSLLVTQACQVAYNLWLTPVPGTRPNNQGTYIS